jgi:hypothetical protein
VLRAVGLSAALAACGADTDEPLVTPPPAGCQPGEHTTVTGTCCPAGTLAQPDSTCLPAGVPICPDGFIAADGGCAAPVPQCPPGQVAFPGEARCHELGDCGAGTWGDIPIEPGTQHVDASSGGNGDGSALSPWATVGEAVEAAADGALVAIAAGTYVEDVQVDRPLRLRGRCAAMVEIAGAGTSSSTLLVLAEATIQDLALSGPDIGLGVTGAAVQVERVRIHDTGSRGLVVQDDLGDTELVATELLVEHATEVGVFTWGSRLELDRVAVRDTAALPTVSSGGIVGVDNPATARATAITVRRALVERNAENGLFCSGATLALVESVVRDNGTTPKDVGSGLRADADAAGACIATVETSVLERNRDAAAIAAGGDLTLSETTLRALHATEPGYGRGVVAERQPALLLPPRLRITGSLLADFGGVAVTVTGGEADLGSTIVRDVHGTDGLGGRGIAIQYDEELAAGATAVVRGSVVERARDVGMFVSGSALAMEATAVRDTLPQAADLAFGRGVHAQLREDARAQLSLQSCVIERSREVAFDLTGASVTIVSTAIRDTLPRETDGYFGHGLLAIALAPTDLTLTGSLVAGTSLVAVASFGSQVAVGTTRLECNLLDLNVGDWHGAPGELLDLGGNHCGCAGVEVPCKVQSESVDVPDPLH